MDAILNDLLPVAIAGPSARAIKGLKLRANQMFGRANLGRIALLPRISPRTHDVLVLQPMPPTTPPGGGQTNSQAKKNNSDYRTRKILANEILSPNARR
jgi:hypothetical protein